MDPAHLNKLFSISNWLFLIPCYCQNSIGDLWNTLVPTCTTKDVFVTGESWIRGIFNSSWITELTCSSTSESTSSCTTWFNSNTGLKGRVPWGTSSETKCVYGSVGFIIVSTSATVSVTVSVTEIGGYVWSTNAFEEPIPERFSCTGTHSRFLKGTCALPFVTFPWGTMPSFLKINQRQLVKSCPSV